MKRILCWLSLRGHRIDYEYLGESWCGQDTYVQVYRALGPCKRCGYVDWRSE